MAAPTKNLEAYTLYLKGRFFFAKLSEPALRRSLDLFQQALLLDPALARAYAGIADAWCNLADDWVAPDDAYPRAKGAAERALQRDPDLAEAITSIGKVLGWHEWKFAEAEAKLARAVQLAPELRRGALRARDAAAERGAAAGRDRDNAEGAAARSARRCTTASG